MNNGKATALKCLKRRRKNADPKSFCLKLPSFFCEFHHFIFISTVFELCTLNNLFVSHAFILSSSAVAAAAVAVGCVPLSNQNVFMSCSLVAHTIQAHANNIIKIFLKHYCSNNYFYFFVRLSLSVSSFRVPIFFLLSSVWIHRIWLSYVIFTSVWLLFFGFLHWSFKRGSCATAELKIARERERRGRVKEKEKKKSVFKRLIREQQRKKTLCEYSLCRSQEFSQCSNGFEKGASATRAPSMCVCEIVEMESILKLTAMISWKKKHIIKIDTKLVSTQAAPSNFINANTVRAPLYKAISSKYERWSFFISTHFQHPFLLWSQRCDFCFLRKFNWIWIA